MPGPKLVLAVHWSGTCRWPEAAPSLGSSGGHQEQQPRPECAPARLSGPRTRGGHGPRTPS